MSLEGFREESFTHAGKTRPVYRRGSGPGVVVMHELPGLHPGVAAFGARVADAGFSVAMPVMFGTPGKPVSGGYIAAQLLHVCISREFRLLAARASSPITDWLRAVCQNLHAAVAGIGVGAIGMCLTGNFALALLVDEDVMAPVLSQPSLPFPFGKTFISWTGTAIRPRKHSIAFLPSSASVSPRVGEARRVRFDDRTCFVGRTDDGRKRREISSQVGANVGVRANGYEVNVEEDGAHECCGEKPRFTVTALWELELRFRGFSLRRTYSRRNVL